MGSFQILGFLEENGIELINNTFAMVGRLYGYMLDISTSSSSKNLNDALSGITTSLYAIAALFMLFRISVSVFNYIIDPDKLSDSKTGGGKLLTNIVVTVILLIAFAPNGFVFTFLNKVEDVFLYKNDMTSGTGDGFFSNLFKNIPGGNKSSSASETTEIAKTDLLTIENVNAATKKLVCYINKSTDPNAPSIGKSGSRVTYTLKNDKITGGTIETSNYSLQIDRSIKNIKNPKCEDLTIQYTKNTNTPGYIREEYRAVKAGNCVSRTAGNTGVTGSCLTMYTSETEATDEASKGNNSSDLKSFGHGLNAREGEFANSVAGAFYSCNIGDDSTRDSVYKKYNKALKKDTFKDISGNLSDEELCYAFEFYPLYIEDGKKEGGKLIKDDSLDASFFVGIVFGLGLMVYLVVLCVEVIIRNLKLMLFQVIAPIPLINGIDPNDQMRKKWLKSYFGAYLDLFLKIFAINLLARIISAMPSLISNTGTLWKLFFLVALLIFVKMIPNLISKTLGIEGLMGSTKEVTGMLKKGVGIGAAAGGAALGAGLGATVGAMTAKGKGGRILGGLRGAARGAGSGWKKDVFGGSQSIASTNSKVNQQKAQGYNFLDRMKINAMEKTGYVGTGGDYKDQIEAYNATKDSAKKGKDELVAQVKKKGIVFDNKAGALMSKDKTRQVVAEGEKIDMKNEYLRQDRLANMSEEEWSSMNEAKKSAIFGKETYALMKAKANEEGKSFIPLMDAQRLQNDRVVRLEDYAAIKYAQTKTSDKSVITVFDSLNDSLESAQANGLRKDNLDAIFNSYGRNLEQEEKDALMVAVNAVHNGGKLTPDDLNSETLGKLESGLVKVNSEIAREHAKEIGKQQYMGNKK